MESKLDDLNRRHEAYWYLRSRIIEVKDGDRNTSYFHHKASQRKRRNRIDGIYDEEGVWREDEDELEGIVGKYYTNLVTSMNSSPLQLQ